MRSALVAGDFNGDGRVDLAVAGNNVAGTGVVAVLLGDGDGTFQRPMNYAAGTTFPSALVAGDFNGDGRVDLADAGNNVAGTGVVSVLLGDGDGTFQRPVTIAAGVNDTTALVAGDFNGDVRVDLAGVGTGLFVKLNQGADTFSDPRALPAAMHATPVLADLNGDGVDDLLVIDQAGQILWRKGQAGEPGSFEPPVTVNPDHPARDLTIVPTRQGPLIASVDAKDDAVSLYAYRGGGFARVGSLPTGLLPAQIESADLTGDGNADLVVRNAGDGTASLYLGDGEGGFTPLPALPIGQGASDIALADVDRSGRIDLVVTNQATGDVRIFFNRGDATFGPPARYFAGSGPYGLSADVSGTPDLSSLEGTAGVAVGTFTPGGVPDLVTINPGFEHPRGARRARRRGLCQRATPPHERPGPGRPRRRPQRRRHPRSGAARPEGREHRPRRRAGWVPRAAHHRRRSQCHRTLGRRRQRRRQARSARRQHLR